MSDESELNAWLRTATRPKRLRCLLEDKDGPLIEVADQFLASCTRLSGPQIGNVAMLLASWVRRCCRPADSGPGTLELTRRPLTMTILCMLSTTDNAMLVRHYPGRAHRYAISERGVTALAALAESCQVK